MNDLPQTLSNRTRNALVRAGITRLSQLQAMSEMDAYRVRGIGRAGLADLSAHVTWVVREPDPPDPSEPPRTSMWSTKRWEAELAAGTVKP